MKKNIATTEFAGQDDRLSICYLYGAQSKECSAPRLAGDQYNLVPDQDELKQPIDVMRLAHRQSYTSEFCFEELCGFFAETVERMAQEDIMAAHIFGRYMMTTTTPSMDSWITDDIADSALRFSCRAVARVRELLPLDHQDWLVEQMPEEELGLYRQEGFMLAPKLTAAHEPQVEDMCKPCWLQLANELWERKAR